MILKDDDDDFELEYVLYYANMGRDLEPDDPISGLEEEAKYLEPAALYYIGAALPDIFSGGKQVYKTRTSEAQTLEDITKRSELVRELLMNIPEQISLRGEGSRGATEGTFSLFQTRVNRVKDSLSPELVEAAMKLLDLMKTSMEQKTIVEDKELPTSQQILDLISTKNSETEDEREDIYRTWEDLFNYFQPMNVSVGVIDLFASEEEEVELGAGMIPKFEQMDGLVLPNYIVKTGAVNVSQYRPAVAAKAILNKFYVQTDYLDRLMTVRGSGEMTGGYRDIESGGQTGEMEEELSDISIEDAKEFLKKSKVFENVDPLLAIEKSLYEDQYFIDEDVAKEIDALKEQIITDLSGSRSGLKYMESFYDLIDEEIKDYISTMNQDIVEREEYYFPMLDDKRHVGIISRLIGDLEYNFLVVNVTKTERGVKITLSKGTEETVMSYSQWVNRVNKDAKRAFDLLQDLFQIQKFGAFVSGSGPAAYGGALLPEKGQEPKVSESYLTTRFSKFISKFYLNALTRGNLFGNDIPEFTKSDEYKSFRTAVKMKGGRFLSGLIRGATQSPNLLNDTTVKSLRKFFEDTNEWLSRSPKAVVNSTERLFYALMDIVILADEGNIREMRRDLANYLGYLLNSDIREDISFLGKPLSSYTEGKPDLAIEVLSDLVDALEDEQVVSYVKTSKLGKRGGDDSLNNVKGLITAIRRREDYERRNRESRLSPDVELMLTKSYLHAVDTFRNNRGIRIYKAYLDIDNVDHINYAIDLIKTEDNVDIYFADIENIVTKNHSFDSLSKAHGVDTGVIYKIKGLFR